MTTGSYSNTSNSPLRFASEMLSLYRLKREATKTSVRELVSEAREDLEWVMPQTAGLDLPLLMLAPSLLEIGPGQAQIQAKFWAQWCVVTTLDRDVIPNGAASYLKMLAHNGLQRTVKTVARKILGFDRRMVNDLRMEVDRLNFPPTLTNVLGDSEHMPFPDKSFEIILCRGVLNHLQTPSQTLCEVKRTLKPGGVFIARTHLYTSFNGALDYKNETPWAHLLQEKKNGKVYLNGFSTGEWLQIFNFYMPGCEISFAYDTNQRLVNEANIVAGKTGLSSEDLLRHTIILKWKKPLSV